MRKGLILIAAILLIGLAAAGTAAAQNDSLPFQEHGWMQDWMGGDGSMMNGGPGGMMNGDRGMMDGGHPMNEEEMQEHHEEMEEYHGSMDEYHEQMDSHPGAGMHGSGGCQNRD
ncbi:hypothetical protein [Alkalicoccus chagannorensis]|uniref:hypothetical protein n=1 Tax=Alkalicoccus chagannorensis TaxID=427072 RepID=UPI00040B7D97|nr:hypothetical protein [Alkalicoccus chagannorensis]